MYLRAMLGKALVGAVLVGGIHIATLPSAPITDASGCGPSELTAAQLNTAFSRPGLGATASQQGFGGGDYQRTYPLPDGRVLWLFQDLHYSNDEDLLNDWPGDAARGASTNAAHNSGLIQRGNCWTILGGRAQDLIGRPQTIDSRRWYWALDGEIGADGNLWIFVVEMEHPTGGGAGPGSRPTGTWLAVFDPFTLRQIDFRRAPNSGTQLYGWSVTSTDQWSYLYGHCYRQFVNNVNGPGQFDSACMPHTYVARVPRGRFDVQPTYWDGRSWSSNAAAARPVMTRGAANPMSVQWFGDSFVSVTKQDDWWGTQIFVDVASQPQGPFQQAQASISILNDRRCSECGLYHAQLMPWLDPQGRVIISISNGAPYHLWMQNARLYRPSFYTIPLPAAPAGSAPTSPPAFSAGAGTAGFVAVDPVRLVDTREPDQAFGRLRRGTVATLDLSDIVPAGTTAAVLNLTTTATAANGWLRAFPCSGREPSTSNVNQRVGRTVTNTAIVPIGDGRLCFTSHTVTDVVVDLNGWLSPESTAGLVSENRRLADTRTGQGGHRRLRAGQQIQLPITSPGSSTEAVALNITAVNPAKNGFVTAWPCGTTRPTVSNLNPVAGVTRPNMANVRVGSNGAVCLYSMVDTDLVVDLTARYVRGAGARYAAVAPQRLLDTRSNGHRWHMSNRADVVPLGSVAAAQVNLTVTDTWGPGFITAYACHTSPWPGTSNGNFAAGDTSANAALLPPTRGYGCVLQSTRSQLVVDLFGVWR
jgi:hypothetical protein